MSGRPKINWQELDRFELAYLRKCLNQEEERREKGEKVLTYYIDVNGGRDYYVDLEVFKKAAIEATEAHFDDPEGCYLRLDSKHFSQAGVDSRYVKNGYYVG